MPDRLIPALSVVMPAYNEQDCLPAVIEEACAALDEICADWELIVVDDASSDRTPEIVREWSRRDPRVRLEPLPGHQGYARGIARGLAAARYDAVMYTDADGQFDLREARLLYAEMGRTDLVVGYRVQRQDPFFRSITSYVYNRLQRWVTGARVRDVNCAFKMFGREYLDRLRLESEGYMIDAEFFGRARQLGIEWREVGVTHLARQDGSTNVRWSTIPETLRGLWRLRRILAG